MKNEERWVPTKFVPAGASWTGSRDPKQLLVASRLAADSFAPRYVEAIEKFAHGRLLDHGCGKAPLYGIYKDKIDEVVAVDWGQSLHDTAYLDLACDLNERMPFEDASFDTIVSSDVVAHLWNPVAVMDDLARVLRPGGALILGTPFNYWLNEEPHDYFRWSRNAIKRLGEHSGLRVAQMWQCGGTTDVLSDVLLKGMQGKMASVVPLADRLLRLTGIARSDRAGTSAFTLGTVAVLVKD